MDQRGNSLVHSGQHHRTLQPENSHITELTGPSPEVPVLFIYPRMNKGHDHNNNNIVTGAIPLTNTVSNLYHHIAGEGCLLPLYRRGD